MNLVITDDIVDLAHLSAVQSWHDHIIVVYYRFLVQSGPIGTATLNALTLAKCPRRKQDLAMVVRVRLLITSLLWKTHQLLNRISGGPIRRWVLPKPPPPGEICP